MAVLIRPRVLSRRWLRLTLVLVALLPAIGLLVQPAAARSIATQPAVVAMHHFVIIFRQGPRTLTDADKRSRTEETGVWARRHNDAGHKLDPHILAPERALLGQEGAAAAQADAWPVTALLFLEARDLHEATRVAEGHPALRYGATIEVRPWAPPTAAAPPVAPPAKSPAVP